MAKIAYRIRKMRVVAVTGKLAAKYPDRLFTVHGEFHGLDAKGKEIEQPLTITSKVIDRVEALDPDFAIDVEAGTLTVPAGERGRKASVGLDAESVAAMLAALSAPAAEPAPAAEAQPTK